MRARLGRATALIAATLGCTTDGGSPRSAPGDSALFRTVESITLRDTPGDPIEEITALAVDADGRLVIVDGPASRVRVFDRSGEPAGVLGGPGAGPGELAQPNAVALDRDSILIVQRGSPRLTVFHGDSVARIGRLPGQYGFWIAGADSGRIVGVATGNERFALLDRDGSVRARFGRRPPAVRETPYWVFFVRERAVRMGDRIIVNRSFAPDLVVFDLAGDSIRSFGTPPPSWVQPDAPPPTDGLDPDTQRQVVADWSRGFTVITQMAVVGDSLLVVGYGRHDPVPSDPYRTVNRTVDVYAPDGRKLHEDVPFEAAIVAGGKRLFAVTGTPPSSWTLSVLELAER